MKLRGVHRIVERSVARGDSMNSQIPGFVKQAALMLERNNTFSYMEKFGRFTVDSTATRPHVITLPTKRIKAVRFIRLRTASGTPTTWSYTYLPRVDAEDASALGYGTPTEYWIHGDKSIILNMIPDEDLEFEVLWHSYTSWPTKLGAETWLTKNAPDLLSAEALILVSSQMRDPRMRQIYTAQRDEALRTVLIADDEFRYQDRDNVMEYSAERYP